MIPIPRSLLLESSTEVVFKNPENIIRMGTYTYVFKDKVDREEIKKFDELLKAQKTAANDPNEIIGEVS